MYHKYFYGLFSSNSVDNPVIALNPFPNSCLILFSDYPSKFRHSHYKWNLTDYDCKGG